MWVYHTAEEMAANCFHNHCQCNYIIVLGIGVTWHSRMSNASKGCQISRVLSSYAGPGRRCINAMWQYQIGCLQSCDIHHSVFLLSKEVTVHDPFKKHGPGRVWTRRGGGGPFMWMVHFSEWGGGPFRSDRSLPVAKDCPQYIPKGNPTPASKLAFVKKIQRFRYTKLNFCKAKLLSWSVAAVKQFEKIDFIQLRLRTDVVDISSKAMDTRTAGKRCR